MQHWREHPSAPASGHALCRLDELPGDNGREFVFGSGEQALRIVLFRIDSGEAREAGDVRAYLNRCPHFHIQYNFQPEVFCVYDIDGRRDLMCAHHTAMFHLDDGSCYDGPCEGARLSPVEVVVEGDLVRIA